MPRSYYVRGMHRLVLCLLLLLASPSPLALVACAHAATAYPGQKVELYFGRTRGGERIDDLTFATFEREVIRPRLPDGYTLLHGHGHWMRADGVSVDEPSTLLVVVFASARALSARWDAIEQIRQAYCLRFAQTLVLRVDVSVAMHTTTPARPP